MKEKWCNLRKFNLIEEYNSIISNSNIINLISKIHEYKGKQSYLLDTKKNTLDTLLKVAKIQSTTSSNKIEGIYTTDKRNEKGEKKIRFTPLSPVETPIAIEDLCKNYNELVNNELCDLLVLIPIFILDFVSIHPFNDGNGRMSRLLTLLLLYKANYLVGKYISIEKIIEETKDSYYDTLEKSSVKWHNNKNDYSYFVEYYLGIILNAYKEFDSRINIVENKKINAYDRIIDIFKDNIIPIDKAFIMNKCPDLSETTIERVLNKLLKEDKIVKISGGRYTKYKWNN